MRINSLLSTGYTPLNSLPFQGKEATRGFTLVELIVVITILAILGTIAFISLQGYSQDARDSVRISDISKIKTSLELFQLDAGKYPETTAPTNITYSGAIAWTQGIFGAATFNNVTKLDKIPTDPITDRKYIYSVTNTKQEYQIAGVMEGDEVTINTNQANASGKTAMLKISGNYNGKLLKVSTGSTDYVLAVPSIITSSGFTLEEIVSSKFLAYNGYKNLPAQYAGSSYEVLGEDEINLVNSDDLVVYSGDIKTLSSSEQVGIDARKILIEKLKSAYSGTAITGIGEIAQIINTDTTDTNATEFLSTTIVRNNLGGSITVSSNDIQINQDDEINYCSTISPSIVSYWKFDNLYYDDYFDESSLNSQRWVNWSSNGGNSSINTTEKKLVTNTLAQASSVGGITSSGLWKLSGDFDIQIDYEITSAWNQPSVLDKVVGIALVDDTYTWVTGRSYNSSGYNEYLTRTNYPSISSPNKISSTDKIGKFRIERIGTTIKSYYYNNLNWVNLSTYTFTSNDLSVRIYSNNKTSQDIISVKWDNFIVNKGKIVSDTKGLNNGTISGTTSTIGQVGNGLSFDGIDDYVNFSDSSSLDITNEISLSVWIKPSVVPPSEVKYIVGKFRYSDNSRSYLLYLGTDGKIYFLLNSDGTSPVGNNNIASSSSISSGSWIHIVGTYDGTKMKLYINGELSSQRDYSSGIYSGSAPLRIASSGENIPTYLLNSAVDDVIIFNKGLTQEEVTKIYNDGIDGNSVCGN